MMENDPKQIIDGATIAIVVLVLLVGYFRNVFS